jgi:hypothetical protein
MKYFTQRDSDIAQYIPSLHETPIKPCFVHHGYNTAALYHYTGTQTSRSLVDLGASSISSKGLEDDFEKATEKGRRRYSLEKRSSDEGLKVLEEKDNVLDRS